MKYINKIYHVMIFIDVDDIWLMYHTQTHHQQF